MDHQAFAQVLGNYGEFVGAIAVVATLAYLSVQVRQNSKMMRATIRFELARASQDSLIQYAGHAATFVKMQQKETLPDWDSEAQEMEAEWLLTSGFRNWEVYAWQHAEGVLDETEWNGIVEDMKYRATFPYFVDQWRRTRARFSETLRSTVDPIFGIHI